jgi:RND family efflux transporter MFP subunit
MLAVAVLAVGLGACDQTPSQSNGPPPAAARGQQSAAKPPQAPLVTVSKPLQREIVDWDEYTGRFDAVETVDVRARVSGYLTEVHFKDGQPVKQGDLLYVIDPRPFERALELAQAELAQASTKVQNATLDVERGKPLVERRIMSEKTFEDRASLLREAQAALKVTEAKVKAAELDLSFTRITSPLTGRAGRSLVSVGNWVSAGGASNTTLLTTIVSQDPIHIYFDVSEGNFIKYRRLAERGQMQGAGDVGAPVEVGLPDEKGFPHKGRLDFVDNRLDQGTGTLRVRAVLDNKANLFSPGLFARVRVAGSAPYSALLLPDEAIGTDQTLKYVYVVDEEGTVARKNVKLGPLFGRLRIVREGLLADDWVIVKGVQRARPGQAVTPQREPIKVSETSLAGETAPSKGP